MSLTPDILLQQLRWRYAVKKFDPERKIAPETWRVLEESLVLTPSSFGLQPWRFVVVSNPELRERLVAASWKQRQIADASHLVVFCIRSPLTADDVDRHVQRMAQVQNVPVERFERLREMVVSFVENPPSHLRIDDWCARQAYIALGSFMTAAALLGIDTCPMEGIDPQQYDTILGLPEQGYATAVACVAGYRANDDKYAHTPKVRFATEDVVQHLD